MMTAKRFLNLAEFPIFVLVANVLLSNHQCQAQLKNSTELTSMLQGMMKTYDKRILPTKNGKPTVVRLQLYIGDMVPVEAIHMHYSIDLYLREFWDDYRLTLPLNSSDQFPLEGSFVKDIWTPDIYFPSGKKGKLHDITRPNSLIRILPNGEIRSSQRVSITSFCPMHLENFPFDEQVCNFYLEPYSYNNKQCRLEWNHAGGGPIFHPENLMMFEFTLDAIKVMNETANYGIFGMYDRLVVKFHFRRNVNYYILQSYFPTLLVVMLSWVGFWIDYRSTPARVALGITTVLTITTLANSIRATLPPVSYSKSIDYYLLACFLFVFAALVEYATVGITDMKWRNALKKLKKKRADQKAKGKGVKATKVKRFKLNDSGVGLAQNTNPNGAVASPLFLSTLSIPRNGVNRGPSGKVNETYEVDTPTRSRSVSCTEDDTSEPEDAKPDTNQAEKEGNNKNTPPPFGISAVVKAFGFGKKLAEKHHHKNEVHVIDKLSRYLFPLVFLIFNALYFAIVLTHTRRSQK